MILVNEPKFQFENLQSMQNVKLKYAMNNCRS